MSISALSSTDSAAYLEELFKTPDSKKKQQADDLTAKLFNALDTDGKGGISLEESGLDQETYGALDTDQDGTVSLEELGQALELQRSAMFTLLKLDSNESGGTGGGYAGSQSSFDAMDTNQDGIVSAEELAAALEKESMNIGANSTRAGIGQKAGDLLLALANRAYAVMAGSETNARSVDFKA